MRLANEALRRTLHMGQIADYSSGPIIFKAGAPDKPLSAAEKKDLLERSRDGEAIKLEVEATTYIQRTTANRNAIRFKDTAAALKKIAKSGKGTPILRDHDQSSVLSRGGTVLTSSAEQVGDEWHFRQRLELVKPWAVEGILDGTIDRFSIGWYPTGPILYSHTGKEVEGWPDFWPGDELEDGTVVEWVYSSAELIEVSGVNVPAVVGTHIEGIRAALAASSGNQQREQPPKDQGMDSKTITILGLAPGASDDQVAAAVRELSSKLERQSVELAASKEQLSAAQAIAERAEAEAAVRQEQKLESDIASLYKQGKLTHRHGANGAVVDPMESHLRKAHKVGGSELFEGLCADLKGTAPTPELQSDESVVDKSGAEYDEARRSRLASSGMSPERHAELAAKKQRMAQGKA